MLNDNKYRLPWKVEYMGEPSWDDTGNFTEEIVVLEDGVKVVMRIVDCDDTTVVSTDCGYYGPREELAEYIVACVNNIDKLKSVLKDILYADERGQGLPFRAAMTKAYNLVNRL